MKTIFRTTLAALCFAGLATTASAGLITTDTFGSGANAFTIDFVNVGNAGNADDAGAAHTPRRMAGWATPIGWASRRCRRTGSRRRRTSGMTNVTAGAWTGIQPAANMTWYEAAAFVNWLNTSTGHQAAYQSQRHGDGADAVEQRGGVAGWRGEPVSAQGRVLLSAERGRVV